jgi:hypothetical protein
MKHAEHLPEIGLAQPCHAKDDTTNVIWRRPSLDRIMSGWAHSASP